MGSENKQALRVEAIKDLKLLVDSDFGFLASGEGRYRLYFGRDSMESIILSLSRKQGEITPFLIEHALKSQQIAALYEGSKFDPQTEEAPGKKPHEIHTKDSPQTRLAELKKNGWPVFENQDGTLGMVYYGAGDTTSLFNISVAVITSVIERQTSKQEAFTYLEKMWPHIERGLKHDIEIADIDKDGLIESSPQNLNALLNHTWKDSTEAYVDENGNIPLPPYKYLTNNCYFLWSLRDSCLIARKLGFTNMANELQDRYEWGKVRLDQTFWSEKLGCYVPLIDGQGNQVEITTDDAIDGLWAVLYTPSRAQAVVERLSQPDMLSRWGVRTRSKDSKQFRENGYDVYHNGLVWPHRNRILAEGAERYGYFDFAANIDARTDAVEFKKGRIECIAVSKDGLRILDYEEAGVLAACKPQSWTVHGSLARSAVR